MTMTTPKDELLIRAVSDVVPAALAGEKLKSGKKLRIYLGIDPTGSKLHLGHSVPLRKLKAFADAGHHVIFLVGSFTAMIGDPSGRDVMREPLTEDQVKANFETYKQQAGKILDFSKIELRYNHEWLEALTMHDLLKLSSRFTVHQMLQRDMFKMRMKKQQDIALTEFLYPLMVGYDSVVLDVDCELGGNDQLFNMLCGRVLQHAYGKRDKFVLTTKLIEGTDGRKMSKTYNNCIWLEDSAKEMYGKILSIKDDLIVTYMECCTDIPMQEVKAAEQAMKKGANPKDYKMRLARAIVTLYHGADAAAHEEAEFQRVFAHKELPEDLLEVKATKGTPLIDVLAGEGLVRSKSEARRLIEQGGVKIADTAISDVNMKIGEGPQWAGGVVVKVGKRRFVKIRI